jgi:hypothetical protein
MIRDIGNFHLTRRSGYVISVGIPKYYINNPSRLIKTAVGSGGVEAAALNKQSSSHTVRLSISPSQGTFLTKIDDSKTISCNHREKILNDSPQFWNKFKKYLSGFNTKKTIYSRLSYAKRYYHLLETEKFDEILQFSNEMIGHIMKALASLSKFLGIYDKWNVLIKKYSLKWSQRNSLDTFRKIFNSEENIDKYIYWIKNLVNNEKIDSGHKNLIIFCVLTGLRASEAIESIRIIKDKENRTRYHDKDKNIIKHYEFSDIFIRRTKKAFISVVNDEILDIAFSAYSDSYSSLQASFRRMNLKLNLNYCRKVFATYLRNKRIEQYIEKEKKNQLEEINRRKSLYRNLNEDGSFEVNGKIVVLVDDGAATGATIIVAARWIRRQNPQKLIVAIPVTSKDTFEILKQECDMVVIGTTPSSSNFKTVSQYYQEFKPVEDEQVIEVSNRRKLRSN